MEETPWRFYGDQLQNGDRMGYESGHSGNDVTIHIQFVCGILWVAIWCNHIDEQSF